MTSEQIESNEYNKILKKIKVSITNNNKLTKVKNAVKTFFQAQNNKNNLHILKFNAMYFKNDFNYTKTYYEVYTSYIMLLSTVDQIKKYIQVNRTQLDNISEINETVNIENSIFEHKNKLQTVSNYMTSFVKSSDITKIFKKINNLSSSTSSSSSSSSSSTNDILTKTQHTFDNYRKQSGLISLGESTTQQTMFEQIVSRYVSDRTIKNILLQLIAEYNMFKNKILSSLTSTNGTFNYGLLGFGFLFANEYFRPLKEDVTNHFTNHKLYDLGSTYVDVEVEAKKLNNVIYKMGSEMMDHMNYFYEYGYNQLVMYELLNKALDMDLSGVRFALHYIHPKYLRLFLKRKEKIDKQLFAYLSSYKIKAPVIEYKDISIFQDFLQGDGLFYDFNSYFIK
jgi:hypothetical protein